MDLVVRTPHGDAELTLEAWDPTATVAELVELATGQASPPLVHIDDRPVVASTLLSDAPILVGSVVSSHPVHDAVRVPGTVRLMQLTARGAGTVRTLEPGTYRLGPGRRRLATELTEAPVEDPLLEIVVGAPTTADVTVLPIEPARASVNGLDLDGSTTWETGQLRVGQRVFALEHDGTVRPARRDFEAEHDGTIQFSRSPQLTRDDSGTHVVDSVRAAQTLDPALWRRRIDRNGSIVLPFGLVDENVVGQPLRPALLTIEAARPAAVAGTPSFRDGVARTLLVEAATRYGPADLSLAIATRPDRLGEWDWAKWLPHVHTADVHTAEGRIDSDIALFCRPGELARWAASVIGDRRVTLLVVDDVDLWSRSDSPLRDLLAAAPPNLLTLALTDRVERAPAPTGTVIRHESDQRCRLIGSGRSLPVVPSLVETDIAATVARALAPLRDAERPLDDESPALASTSMTLEAALGAAEVDEQAPSSPVPITLGTSPLGQPVEVPWAPGAMWSVIGADPDEVATNAVIVLLSVAVRCPPARTPIVVVAPPRSAIADIVGRLPHFAGHCDVGDPGARERLLARVARHLDDGGAAVVVADSFEADADRTAFMSRLDELRARRPALRVLDLRAEGTSPDSSTASGAGAPGSDVTISVDRRSRQRHASANSADGSLTQAFTPFSVMAKRSAPTTTAVGRSLVARPFVFGRALSPLERRLERVAPAGGSFDLDEATDRLLGEIARAHHRGARRATPLLMPVPLPTAVSLEQLLTSNEADAVPIGLADDPGHDHHEIVWWQPGPDGSMLFIGTPRSGVQVALWSLTIGLRERFGPNDLVVYAIDASNRRLNVIRQLPNTRERAGIERLDKAADIVDEVAREVVDRRSSGTSGRPDVLLMIGDLTQLGRRLHDSSYSRTIDRLLVAASGADVGINVVATAARSADSCGLSDVIDRKFVGALSSTADAAALGLDFGQLAGLDTGRCLELTTGRLVQLATAIGIDDVLSSSMGSPR